MITVLAEGRDTTRGHILDEDTTSSLFRVHTFVTTRLLHIHILNLTYFLLVLEYILFTFEIYRSNNYARLSSVKLTARRSPGRLFLTCYELGISKM